MAPPCWTSPVPAAPSSSAQKYNLQKLKIKFTNFLCFFAKTRNKNRKELHVSIVNSIATSWLEYGTCSILTQVDETFFISLRVSLENSFSFGGFSLSAKGSLEISIRFSNPPTVTFQSQNVKSNKTSFGKIIKRRTILLTAQWDVTSLANWNNR